MIRLTIPCFLSLLFINVQVKSQNMEQADKNAEIITVTLKDDGTFPNNDNLPLIVYRQAIVYGNEGPEVVEKIFSRNGWGGSWRNGIYGYHHYHSTAHEVLGVYSGSCKVQLGGPEGRSFDIKKGDVVLIPAGVAHKNLGSSSDFRVVGAYPEGQSWDMNYGKPGERPAADENIAKVALPEMDPVFGKEGPVNEQWNK
jgi:uncharacterized protein YjlB